MKKRGILTSDKGWDSFLAHTYGSNGGIYIGGNMFAGGNNDRFISSEIEFKTTIGKTDSIVYTYNAETKEATFYANGTKLAQKNFITDPEKIGYFEINNSQKIYSKISFYDKVLTESEIIRNFAIDKQRFDITTE